MRKVRVTSGLSCLMAFIMCFVIFGSNCAMSYDTVVNGVLGIQTTRVVTDEDAEVEDTVYYKSAYGDINADSLKALKADTYAEAVQEQEEGTVLLYNRDNALPLRTDEQLSLFGHAVAQPLYRSQSAGSRAYSTKSGVDLYKALGTLKFKVNPKLYNAYLTSKTERKTGAGTFFDENSDPSSQWSLGEEKIDFYTDDLKSSWEKGFNDVAIVMLAREGGEGVELYTKTPTEGISQLALCQEEKDLLAMIRDSGTFKKTIVLLNSGNPMEVDWIEEYDVDAVLWIGCPGEKGFTGVANILAGNANPSGRLVDTYAVSSLSAPAVANNSFNNQQWANLTEALKKSSSNPSEISYYTVQTEGIYIGYKYYETRYEDQVLGRFNADGTAGSIDGAAWNYAKEVSYPFGYGLSYTTFEQKLDQVAVEDKTVTVTVTVTNTGSVPGKSVVQVYAQTPYGEYEQKNKVEKSAIQLLDYGKTDLLEPGASQTLTIVCDKYLLASYDYVNAKGYILSEGDYYISIGDDAHDALNNVLAVKGASGMVDVYGEPAQGDASKVFHFTGGFDDETYRYSVTGARVTNQFEDADVNYWYEDLVTYLTRSDWQGTFPTQPVAGLTLNDEMIRILDGKIYEKPDGAPTADSVTQGDQQGIMLITMKGLDYDDDLWDSFLSNGVYCRCPVAYLYNPYSHRRKSAARVAGVPADPFCTAYFAFAEFGALWSAGAGLAHRDGLLFARGADIPAPWDQRGRLPDLTALEQCGHAVGIGSSHCMAGQWDPGESRHCQLPGYPCVLGNHACCLSGRLPGAEYTDLPSGASQGANCQTGSQRSDHESDDCTGGVPAEQYQLYAAEFHYGCQHWCGYFVCARNG